MRVVPGPRAFGSDFEEAAFAMVLNRLCDPMSKLAMTEWMRDVYRPEWARLELHHFYRALDFLADHKDEIETGPYRRSAHLFNLDVDLVLWDTTTTYFYGQRCESLARYGFSKDKRPDMVQIMIGVMLTRDGFPMGREVFPGDTAEVERFRVAGHAVPYDDLLRHLEQVKAVEINLDGKRYLARTELVGHADLAFRALGARPPQWVTELPRRRNDPGEECCGTRDSIMPKNPMTTRLRRNAVSNASIRHQKMRETESGFSETSMPVFACLER